MDEIFVALLFLGGGLVLFMLRDDLQRSLSRSSKKRHSSTRAHSAQEEQAIKTSWQSSRPEWSFIRTGTTWEWPSNKSGEKLPDFVILETLESIGCYLRELPKSKEDPSPACPLINCRGRKLQIKRNTDDVLKLTLHSREDKQILECYFEYGLPNGLFRRYWESGELGIEAHFDLGKLHGNFTLCHANGSPKIAGPFSAGKREGIFRYYRDNGDAYEGVVFTHGDLLSEIEYSDDAPLPAAESETSSVRNKLNENDRQTALKEISQITEKLNVL